jgi:hypothetical protein
MTAENTSSEPGSEFWHGTGDPFDLLPSPVVARQVHARTSAGIRQAKGVSDDPR